MKIYKKSIIFLCGLMFCLSASPSTLIGKVVGVSDGDTITLLDSNNVQYKIRLSGIDAPEKKQAFGMRSKEHLSDLIFSKTVTVEWHKTDRYQRTLGKVLLNGSDINLEQIRAGFAWHYKQYQSDQSQYDRDAYSKSEVEARTRRIGLWYDSAPIPPWDFRHGAKTVNKASSTTNADCSCGSGSYCVGKKNGHFCYSDTGKKRYTNDR